MEERKLFSVVALGELRYQTKEGEGFAPPITVQVQIVLSRFNTIEEACEYFNSLANPSFQPYARPAIIAQTIEH